jgi:hypothetical protein
MFRTPGWPFVLAQLKRALGDSLLATRLALAAWNGVGCVALALLAHRVWSNRDVATAAGLLWACWPAAVSYPGTRSATLGTESLAIPLMVVAVLVLALGAARDGRLALAGGGLLGACGLVRSNLSLLIPLAAVWLLAFGEGRLRQRVGHALLVLIGAAAVVGPWMIRNYERLGTFALASQRDVLFLGHNAWGRGSYDGDFFNSQSAQVQALITHHPGFLQASEIEKAAAYSREAMASIREYPARETWLLARKAALFLSPLRETEDGDSAYDWVFATVAVVCVAGWRWRLPRHAPGEWLLALPIVTALVTCLLVYFMPRYRYPAEPMMAAFACQAVSLACARHGAATVAGALGLLLAGNLAIALVLM